MAPSQQGYVDLNCPPRHNPGRPDRKKNIVDSLYGFDQSEGSVGLVDDIGRQNGFIVISRPGYVVKVYSMWGIGLRKGKKGEAVADLFQNKPKLILPSSFFCVCSFIFLFLACSVSQFNCSTHER